MFVWVVCICVGLGLVCCIYAWCLDVVCCSCVFLVGFCSRVFNSVVYFIIQVLCVCILFNLVYMVRWLCLLLWFTVD